MKGGAGSDVDIEDAVAFNICNTSKHAVTCFDELFPTSMSDDECSKQLLICHRGRKYTALNKMPILKLPLLYSCILLTPAQRWLS